MNLPKRNAIQLILCLLLAFVFTPQFVSAQYLLNPDTVKAGKFDNGKMWAFDFPPVNYLEETYGFEPSEEWLEDVRLSALRLPGCTASFVSEDGLVMTNNHCAEGVAQEVEKEGEDFRNNGFYAATLEEERQLPDYYADQLVFMKDVTEEVQDAIDKGETETEKIENKEAKIEELKTKYEEETGLKIELETFFNDSKFSIYGFKHYTDVRLVFLPEERAGFFGGDFDNFTYPRYNLDCSFYRIYDEDGKPLKSKNFFQWSKDGAKEGEVIFTVGNPGTTNRLKTVAQLKYLRDVAYGNMAFLFDENYKAFEKYKFEYPDKADEFERFRFEIGNGQKVFTNIVKGLNEPYLVARKQAFENKLKEAVDSDSDLKEKYGAIWETIERTTNELSDYKKKITVYKPGRRGVYPEFLKIANKLIELADQLKLPEDERDEEYKGEKLDEYVSKIIPEDYDEITETIKLSVFVDFVIKNLGPDNFITKDLFDGESGMEAAEDLVDDCIVKDKEEIKDLVAEGADAIYNSDDPFIRFFLSTKDELEKLEKLAKEADDTQDVYENLLGQLIFEVYGTTIPPDANFTLRLSDGILKGFEYNGTITPVKTTFFGMYDRYYSFDKEYPWDLPKRWQTPPAELDLSTPFNFTSTHDIVGGNSGSPIINKNAEIVGLAFDGNIKSIIGNFIYMPEENRCVAVASQAMVEAFRHIYGYTKLADELVNGRIPD